MEAYEKVLELLPGERHYPPEFKKQLEDNAVKALQRLMPEIRAEDLKAAPAGVRAQAVTRQGGLVDDFLIIESENMVNVNNAPSPAATSSLNIGKLIVEKLEPRLKE